MKKFTLTFVVLLLLVVTFAQAAKVRRGEKRVIVEDVRASETDQASKTDATETDTNKQEKEVHKRGILHYGATAGTQWPKIYASHYGYGLNLPAATVFAAPHPLTVAHQHAAPALKYHGHGFHYKTLASPAVLPAATGFNSAWPSYSSLSPAVSHGHAVATAQPFIIRPGGAVVQSYSVTYPHRKPVKPIHSFASLSPVHNVPPVQTAVAAVQPVHSFQTVQAVQHVHPVQPVAAISPVHHLTPVAAAPPPLQTVVQVQQFKPPFHYYDTQQQFPSFFQTSFIPPAPAVLPSLPEAPAVGYGPAQPPLSEFPALPTFPHSPDFPTIPAIPVIPSQPAVPDVPAVPAIPSIPSIPNIPTIPSIPNFPQPQVPSNSFFPVNVQPPLNQKPPAFGGIDHPVPLPDFGSANASPQIPAHPSTSSGSAKPQLPDSTQTPWKPVLYEPPAADSPLERPSNTLLPPYGTSSSISPAEGYLPPAPSSHSGRFQQQEYTIDSSLFDNLSDADIQQIFTQASLAAHRDHHHHTVHNYHTRY